MFTSATDLFPSKVSGSVVGLGATTGGIGGMLMTLVAAMTIQWTGNQQLVFVWAGLMHPLSLLIFWFWLGPNFRVAERGRPAGSDRTHTPLLIAGVVLIARGPGARRRDLGQLGRLRQGGEAGRRRAGGHRGGRRLHHRPDARVRGPGRKTATA